MSLESTPTAYRNQSESETNELTFHDACANGNLKVVKIYLVQQGFDVNVGVDNHGITGFHLACLFGNLNVIEFLLLQKGFDWNVSCEDGTTGFHLACFYGNISVIQFLIQQGFEGFNELGFDDMTGLEMLIEQKHDYHDDELLMPCILSLIEVGAQLNENYVFEELIFAIQNRIIEITFMKEAIFKKWTGRIAQAITYFSMDPFTNTSLQNLSQFLD